MSSPPARGAARPGARQRELRIIGGRWRGRRWRFAQADIRPTPDRVRETLFNWLQDRVAGAECLDLFAGSGALGLEALSRGAARVDFVERDARAMAALRVTLAAMASEPLGEAELHCCDALQFLSGRPRGYDLVFVDPPYALDLQAPVAARLQAGGWLRAGSLVYIEAARRDGEPTVPAGWQRRRSGTTSEVGYHLYELA